MAFLRHYWNGKVVSVYEIKGITVIGRHPGCNISIDDPTISGRHVRLEENKQDVDIIDLDSTNGIHLNGEKVLRKTLTTGDIISVGTHEFEYLLAIPNDLDKTLKIRKSWIPGVYFTD